MDFFDVLRARRSVRSFQDREIPDDVFRKLAESIVCAPSACNRQPYRFLWVRSPELRRQLHSTTMQPAILDAPVVVAGCVNRSAAWRRDDSDDREKLDDREAAPFHRSSCAFDQLWMSSFVPNLPSRPQHQTTTLLRTVTPLTPSPETFTRPS